VGLIENLFPGGLIERVAPPGAVCQVVCSRSLDGDHSSARRAQPESEFSMFVEVQALVEAANLKELTAPDRQVVAAGRSPQDAAVGMTT
jgi:hypothetical protein